MSVNESQNRGLTPKQQRAIDALLSEPTTKEAATVAKVGEATLHRWLNQPDFSAAFRAARSQLLDATLTRLQQVSGNAVDALQDVMNDEDAQPAARVSAARAVLEMVLKAREAVEIEERFRTLEQKIDALSNHGMRLYDAKAQPTRKTA